MRSLLDTFWDKSKKKAKGNKKQQKHVSFWFDEDQYSRNFVPYGGQMGAGTESIVQSLKLAGFRRSCANFVHILTGDTSIKVIYNSEDKSYTDGRTVVISGDINAEKFDSTVGLALHEASHIKYTDFSIFPDVLTDETEWNKYITEKHIKAARTIPGFAAWFDRVFERDSFRSSESPWFTDRAREAMFFIFKDLVNWIEDRRIDNLSFNAAPGYRPYYTSLYDRYWNSEEVDEMIAGKAYRTESVDSYVMRIINLLSPKNDSKALKHLQEIEEMIDVKNILRLKSTVEVSNLASQVFLKILQVSNRWSDSEKKQTDFKDGKSRQPKEVFGQSPTLSVFPSGDDFESMMKKLGFSQDDIEKLIEALKNQKDMINGEVAKAAITSDVSKSMETLQSSGTTIREAGDESLGGKVNVVVVNHIDMATVDSPDFRRMFRDSESNMETINRGFALGNTLGKKIQIRNEERSLKFTRQKGGRVERRLVSNLGFDSESIFSRVEIDKYSKCHVHISIDISGSMAGERYEKSLETATAIAKACTMVKNLECVISFRGTSDHGSPVLLIGYDSRKDNLSHIRKFFPMIYPAGSTPESLCFQVMGDILPVAGRENQVLFVNISDGEPAWRGVSSDGNVMISYGDNNAVAHCRKMMHRISNFNGAAILGYFIGDGSDFGTFTSMYGVDNSVHINETSNIFTIATSLNKKFLEAGRMKVSHE